MKRIVYKVQSNKIEKEYRTILAASSGTRALEYYDSVPVNRGEKKRLAVYEGRRLIGVVEREYR